MSIYGVCENKCLRELNNIFGNTNLLVNGDFQVWQRGNSFDASVSERYSADRWIRRNLTTKVNKLDKGLRISNGGGQTDSCGIGQPIDNIEALLGKTVTLSVKVTKLTGKWKLCMTKANNGAHVSGFEEVSAFITTTGVHTVTFNVPSTKNYKYHSIQLYSTTISTSDAIEIEYIKMEEGSIPTCNLRLPYIVELLECQRYYNKFPVVYSTRRKAWSSDASKTLVPALPFTDMRGEPTIKCASITSLSGSDLGVSIASSRIAGNKYLTMLTLSADISEQDVFINDLELNAEIY